MKKYNLGSGLAAIATGTANDMDTSPFTQKHNVLACIDVTPTFNGTVFIEGSNDGGLTYTTIATITGVSQANQTVEVLLPRFVRQRVSAWVAGSANCYLVANN